MILIDTNIWIDHLHTPVGPLLTLLETGEAFMHPYVLGELALGTIADRERVLARWAELLPAPIAAHSTVMALIEGEELQGSGIGYVDAHLLASALLTADGRLWTRDQRMKQAANRLDVAVPFA